MSLSKNKEFICLIKMSSYSTMRGICFYKSKVTLKMKNENKIMYINNFIKHKSLISEL